MTYTKRNTADKWTNMVDLFRQRFQARLTNRIGTYDADELMEDIINFWKEYETNTQTKESP